MKNWHKLGLIVLISVPTLALHYGWNPAGTGPNHLLHAIHGRLCYVPILLAAGWFGLRGGVLAALGITLAVTPFIIMNRDLGSHNLVGEYTEIVFYFSLGTLVGWLFDRQRSADRERALAERKLAQSERLGMLGRMVASVAHELRNPLGSIRGSAEILAEDIPTDQPQREFVDIIQSETQRLQTIVNAYLEYGAPKLPERKTGDLIETLRETISRFAPKAKNLELTTDWPEHLVGSFDSEQISRVIINLLTNAADAIPNGGRILVSARTRDAVTEIEVADSGPGVAEELTERLFEPFVTSKATGSGLGLVLSREIAEAHGGHLELAAPSGRLGGAVFRLTLPLESPARKEP